MAIIRHIFRIPYLLPAIVFLLFMAELSCAVRSPTRHRCHENAATEQIAMAVTFVASNRISDCVLTRRCHDSTSKIPVNFLPGTSTPSFSQCLILISHISEQSHGWCNKIKFFLSTPWRHGRGTEVWLHSFLTSAIDGLNGQLKAPVVLYLGTNPITSWMGYWMGPIYILGL